MQKQTIQNNLPIKFLVAGRTASGKSTIVKAVCERLRFLNDGTIEDSIDKMSKIILNQTNDLIKEDVE